MYAFISMPILKTVPHKYRAHHKCYDLLINAAAWEILATV